MDQAVQNTIQVYKSTQQSFRSFSLMHLPLKKMLYILGITNTILVIYHIFLNFQLLYLRHSLPVITIHYVASFMVFSGNVPLIIGACAIGIERT